MKNLKKVLALVLAFACAFTMFAGAAFTDAADIKTADAVDTLVALGVLEGYPDGSFRPDATVTRAEMAKMIYTIRTGKSDASAYNEDKTTFTDINGHWARGYIKYCQSLGIIAGKSATKFDPDATVTTQEAAKMLLVTLGYNAERAGLVGATWGQKTIALADEHGLLKGVTSGTTGPAPRQFAAQLMYNTIFATTVVLRDGEYTKYGYDNKENPTVGKKFMDLDKVDAGQLYTVKKVDGKDYYTIETSTGPYYKVPLDMSSLIGQEIKVLRKDGNNTDKNFVYGVYASEDSKVLATGYVGQLESVNDSKKIKLAGTEYKLNKDKKDVKAYPVNVKDYKIDEDSDAVRLKDLNSLVGDVNGEKRTRNNAAAPIKLIDNDGDGKVDIAVRTPVKIGKVTSVTTTSVTIDNGVGTKKFADDTIYDGIAKNDYVCVVDSANVAEGGSHVTKLDVINAKVDGERTGEARVDGTWYKLASVDGKYITAQTNTTYNLVIVGNTILFAEETQGSVQNIAFVSAMADNTDQITGDNNKTHKVRMYLADGTDLGEVKVSKLAGTKLTGKLPDDFKESMVTYTKLSDGTYDIKLVSDANKAGNDDYVPKNEVKKTDATNNSVYYDSKIGGVSINEDAVVFVKTKKETKVLTGKQVKDWSKSVAIGFEGSYLVKASNGIDYIKAATLTASGVDMPVPGSKDTLYAYATKNEYTATVDGESKAAIDVWNGTEVVTLYADAGAMISGNPIKAGDLVSYKVNGKFIDNVERAYFEASVLGFDGKAEGEIKVLDKDGKTTNTYTLSKDVVVLTVDDKNNNGVAGASIGSIVEAGYNTTGNVRIPNIMFRLGTGDDAKKVVAIVIDSENNQLA